MKKQRGNQSDRKSSVKESKESRSASSNPGTKAISANPVSSKPAAAKAVAAKPAAAKPVSSSKPAAAEPISGKPVGNWEVAGIKKQYLKSRSACKVTFRLPKEAAPDAQKVNIVGDFNNWDGGTAVMKRLKSGDFTITMELETGREYCYRFLIDATKWENDWCADRYRPNPFGCDDSVVIL
ncbi:hypothetical protein MNBD_NITROSPIRAE02-224 [hydrothermal vent metagenome]|uniref:Glycoside hydrolase family 13 N-terminal domain-containing protein n=1 Tax=hydrothermal vent metagenome TaxID=652676 RepID=A0A3B1DV27_9ZZZZ